MKTPVAIVGIGCIFPDAPDLARYWANIKRGHDAIREVPASHWPIEDYVRDDPTLDFTYARRGGFIPPIDFDPLAFGILPDNLEATDTTQLLGMLVAQRALDDAGFDPTCAARDKVSVVLGVTGTLPLVIPLGARLGHPIWRRALDEAGVEADVAEDVVARIADAYVPWKENSFPGLLGNVAAGRIANRLDLHGTNCVVDAACASSLSAAHLAAMELETGRADLVVTGGLDTFNDIFMYMCFSQTPALSPTGDVRPFAAAGDGTLLGEGLGIVVLKRLDEAEADGDRIYAVLRAMGTSSDGKGQAIYAPSAAGQERALRAAYAAGKIAPDTVELVESHGTGTRVGDTVEATALTTVYREARDAGTWCALGSVKSQIGHTKAAAGAAGLIKAALALHHRVLPPTLKVEQPLEVLAPGTTPFYVNTEARPWLPPKGHPRRAAVSAFGFGGSNFHCLLEEHIPSHPEIDWTGTVQVVPFGAATRAKLAEALQSFEALATWPERRARAATLRATFDPKAPCRLAFACGPEEAPELSRLRARVLDDAAGTTWSTPDGASFRARASEGTKDTPEAGTAGGALGGVAFLFPGQGAQGPGMLRDLACTFSQLQEALAEADTAFAGHGDAQARLSDRIYPHACFGAEAKARAIAALQATDVAQPALGAVSLGALEILRHFGLEPDAVAGHSYGELVALHAAGVFDREALHALSRTRGALMAGLAQDAAGTMLAVRCDLPTLESILATSGIDVVIANRNTPTQNVLSGASAAIDAAKVLLEERGIATTPLAVAAAFHSPQVACAEAPLREALEAHAFEAPRVPVYANTTAQPYPARAADARARLASQLARPVEFCASIEAMHKDGVRTFIEVGPGARLTGMVQQILGEQEAPVLALALDASGGRRDGMLDLARLLAQLAVHGLPVKLERWDPDAAKLEGKLGRRPKLTVSLCGANHVSPRKKRPPRARPAAPAAPEKTRPVAPRPPSSQPRSTPTQVRPMHDDSRDDPRLDALSRNLQALLQMQSQTADLHRLFLEGQEAAQASFRELIARQQGLLVDAPRSAPAETAPARLPVAPDTSRPAAPDAPRATAPIATSPAMALAPALLQIVSERTGYPLEVLELDMDLDTDLGIDSIKRVEILSALQAQIPGLPAPDPETLGKLHTLGEIVAHMEEAPATSQTPAAAPRPAQSDVAPHSADDGETLATALLEVVAEKTGYPLEVLELDMDLDTDLGIDSIKRVEILSALQARHPELPAPGPEALAELRTLGAIVEHLGAPVPGQDGANGVSKANGVADVNAASQTNGAGSANGARSFDTTPPASAATPDAEHLLARSVVETVPLEPNPERIDLATGAPIWITDDGSALPAALAEHLAARALVPTVVSWDPAQRPAPPERLAGLLLLAPAKGADATLLTEALVLLQSCHKALENGAAAGGALIASLSRMDGRLGQAGTAAPEALAGGALAGLLKTACLEWPSLRGRVLDLDPRSEPTSDEVLAALLQAGPVEVGLGPEGLCAFELRPATVPEGGWRLGPDDRVLLTGGARGVTAAAALAIAEATGATLLLIGRSPAPEPEPAWLEALRDEREVKRALIERAGGNGALAGVEASFRKILRERELRQNLAALDAAGSKVIYRSVDVRDAQALAAVLADFKETVGAPTVLIHGAGVLADATLPTKTAAELEQVWSTKVEGFEALRAALGETPLKALAFFSSTTARLGRPGQADYAAANEALNKLAHLEQARRPQTRVVSIGWGPWEGGMVTPALARLFEAEGVPLIPLRAGAKLLLAELQAPVESAVEIVVLGGETQALKPRAARDATNGVRATNGTGATEDALTRAFSITLDPASQPFLADHVIAGQAVLPLALSAEWLAQAAMQAAPGRAFIGFDDLRLLRGLRLEGREPQEIELAFAKPPQADGALRVSTELRTPAGRANVRAKILLADSLQTPSRDDDPAFALDEGAPGEDAALFPFARESLYEVLFHGPALHTIEQVTAFTTTGIAAKIHRAPPPARWLTNAAHEAWVIDPLALDAAFQLAILWSVATRGEACLPARVAAYRQWVQAFPETMELRAQIEALEGQTLRLRFEWRDHEGRRLAAAHGVEMILDQALTEAFALRTLAQPAAARPRLDER